METGTKILIGLGIVAVAGTTIFVVDRLTNERMTNAKWAEGIGNAIKGIVDVFGGNGDQKDEEDYGAEDEEDYGDEYEDYDYDGTKLED